MNKTLSKDKTVEYSHAPIKDIKRYNTYWEIIKDDKKFSDTEIFQTNYLLDHDKEVSEVFSENAFILKKNIIKFLKNKLPTFYLNNYLFLSEIKKIKDAHLVTYKYCLHKHEFNNITDINSINFFKYDKSHSKRLRLLSMKRIVEFPDIMLAVYFEKGLYILKRYDFISDMYDIIFKSETEFNVISSNNLLHIIISFKNESQYINLSVNKTMKLPFSKFKKIDDNNFIYDRRDREEIIVCKIDDEFLLINIRESTIKNIKFKDSLIDFEKCQRQIDLRETDIFSSNQIIKDKDIKKLNNFFKDDNSLNYSKFKGYGKRTPSTYKIYGYNIVYFICILLLENHSNIYEARLFYLEYWNQFTIFKKIKAKIIKILNIKEDVFIEYLICNYCNNTSDFININHFSKQVLLDELKLYSEIPLSESIKWKRERLLYDLVVKIYPDAIFQYRASFLGNQSLDVYIPSLRIGMEYNGIQHKYEVDYFNRSINKQSNDDEKKLEKCKKNNIKIIYFWYYEDINTFTIKEKINYSL